MMSKRSRDDEDDYDEDEKAEGQTQVVPSKRPRADEGALILKERKEGGVVALAKGINRTSGLLAPNMKLSGHAGHIYTCRFNPKGTQLAASGYDRRITVWNVYGECENTLVLKGHKNSVLDLWWGQDGDMIFTASADNSGAVWDIEAGERLKRLREHTAVVNSICGNRRGTQLIATGSDDCNALLYDLRSRKPIQRLSHEYQITSVCFSDDTTQLFTAGIDPDIHCWDLRKEGILYSLSGHNETVTGLRISKDGSFLLSNSMDLTLRSWDIRPYVKGSRALATFTGHQHDFQQNLLRCAWSHDGSKVSAGSSDTYVYIWDVKSARILYKLPGHKGSVNDVDFHPQEPITLSGSSDQQMFLGEIVYS